MVEEEGSAVKERTTHAMYYSKRTTYKGKNYALQIWDTAGQEKYKAIAPVYLREADCAILVFDIGRKSTFTGLNDWFKILADYGPKNVPRILVANKIDLGESCWQTTMDQFEQLAKSKNCSSCMTSAKQNQGISELVLTITQLVCEKHQERTMKALGEKIKGKTKGKSKSKCCV